MNYLSMGAGLLLLGTLSGCFPAFQSSSEVPLERRDVTQRYFFNRGPNIMPDFNVEPEDYLNPLNQKPF